MRAHVCVSLILAYMRYLKYT